MRVRILYMDNDGIFTLQVDSYDLENWAHTLILFDSDLHCTAFGTQKHASRDSCKPDYLETCWPWIIHLDCTIDSTFSVKSNGLCTA